MVLILWQHASQKKEISKNIFMKKCILIDWNSRAKTFISLNAVKRHFLASFIIKSLTKVLVGGVYKMIRKRSVAIELRLRAEAEARREAREKLKMILVR